MAWTGASPSLCLFLLHCLSTLSLAEDLSTPDSFSAVSTDTIHPNITDHSSLTHEEATEGQNMTTAQCLVDNQMGLIAIGSAGGLILCLLLTVLTLACQLHHLQRRIIFIPRSSRSNVDLHWAAVAMETEGGVVGPCDNSVMLEEVKTHEEEEEEERLAEIKEEREDREEEEEEDEDEEEGATGTGLSPEEKPLMQRESSSDLTQDLAQDLEDMPLVV